MMKYDNIMAIDPDVDRSGVAVLNMRTRQIECHALSLPELVDYILQFKGRCLQHDMTFVIVVEAGWMAETNWHIKRGDRAQKIASIGAKVGRNHEIGHQIVLFCQHYHAPYEEKRPLVKCWSGPDRKISQGEMERLLAGMNVSASKCRMNQEMRDAALLALDRSGFPMRMAK